jgi:transcriptional regulator with XRE-family HTH domain
MNYISDAQVRAARSLLRWGQEDLERSSGISATTIRTIENGGSITSRTAEKLRAAFEQSGIEFLEDDGVKWRNDVCVIYRGADCFEKLFDDIAHSVKKSGGDIVCVASSQEIMMEFSGLPQRNNLERLDIVYELADIKCVVAESMELSVLNTLFELRSLPQSFIGSPQTYIVYGNKYAHIVRTGVGKFIIVVYDLALTAKSYRSHFDYLWDAALLKQAAAPKKRIAK